MAKILVVDDEPDMRLAIRYLLAREGHEVQEAEDGEAAIAFVMQRPVDLVLLDIRLPGVDGIEALKKIREFRQNLPVVMITGYGSVETAVELLKLGASQYLQKPFDSEQLLKVVDETLVGVRPPPDSNALHRSMLAKIGLVGAEAAASVAPMAVPAAAGSPIGIGSLADMPVEAPTPSPLPMKAIAAPALPPVIVPAAERNIRNPPPAPKDAPAENVPKPAPAPPRPKPAARPRPKVEPPKANHFPAIVVVAALGCAAGYWFWSRLPKTESRDIAIPEQTPSGLAFTSDGLWVCDWATQTVSLLNSDYRIVRRVKLDGVHPAGVAAMPGYLYLSDPFRKVIERRRLDKDLTLESVKASPGPAPGGLAFDGTSIWSVDTQEARVYRHDPVSLDARASYPAPGKQPIGVYVDGTTVWTADGATKFVYRHSLEPTLPVQEILEIPAISANPAALTAFTFFDGHFWLTQDGSPVLLERHPTAFTPRLTH